MVMRLIDADALKETIENAEYFDISQIDEAPTVETTEREVGEWVVIMDEPTITFDACKCSECGAVEYFNKGWKKFNFCPNCGAKMKVEE